MLHLVKGAFLPLSAALVAQEQRAFGSVVATVLALIAAITWMLV